MDIGDAGIRAIGVLWLLTAGLMVASAAGLALQARKAESIVLPAVLVSLVLCLIEVPQARIGLALTVGLVLLLLRHPALGQAGPFTSASISCDPVAQNSFHLLGACGTG